MHPCPDSALVSGPPDYTGLCVHPGQSSLPPSGAVAGPIRPLGGLGGGGGVLLLPSRGGGGAPPSLTGGGGDSSVLDDNYPPPPVCHSVGLLFLYGALDSHLFFPSHVASGRCFLSAAAAGAPAGVVSAFAEPSRWRTGAVLEVVGCAVCASAAPSSWRIGGCVGYCRGRLTVFAVHTPLSTGRPWPASLCFCVREAQVPCSSTRCPGRPPYVLFPLTAGLPLMDSHSCCANSPSGLRETPPPPDAG